MITIPSDLLHEVDAAARRAGQKRSHLIRQALVDLLERQRKEEFDTLLAEGYTAVGKDIGAIASESLGLQAAASEGVWEWKKPR